MKKNGLTIILLLLLTMAFTLFGKTGNGTVVWAATEGVAAQTSIEMVCNGIKLESTMNQAIGTSNQLYLYNNTLKTGTYSLKWISSKPAIAKVNAKDGTIEALTEGTTVVTCVLKVGQVQYQYSCQVTVTDPQFSQDTYYIRSNEKTVLPINGSSTKNHFFISSNDAIVTDGANGTSVVGKKAGTAYITVEVDRRYISCRVVVSAPKINYSNLFLTTDKAASLTVTGHWKKSPVTFTSSNKSIVTVTSKGYVKAIKRGSAVITITVDGRVYSCYVAVSKSGITDSLNRAYKALGSKYSQTYRMKKGYYDCSSLVWRSYSPSGYLFGNKSYAPTAAYQANRLVKEKKVLAYEGISQSKLLPGDVIYLKGSTNNGRYKNISHVAIYIGNGRILHAKDEKGGVCIESYNTYKKRIVVIGRL